MDIEIPYNVEERKDTGLYNSKLGIWLFLASEIMLFGALFSTYIILRTGDPFWMLHVKEAHLNIPLATLNTAVLILSSVTFVMSSLNAKDATCPAVSRTEIRLFVSGQVSIQVKYTFAFLK